jgi:hypothetical protein
MQSSKRSDAPWLGPPTRLPRWGPLAILALAAGLAIRVAGLSLPGTYDVIAWKTWSYAAATEGPAHVYGHEFPPVRHIVKFGDHDAVANYPPMAIYELAIIGHVYRFATGGLFPDGPALTMTIKGAIVLADAVMALLIFGTVRKFGAARAAWSAAAYWISPAALLCTTLGYIDVFAAVPAVGAVVAAASGRPVVAGALFAAAAMTKPQALFAGPAVALALWNVGDGGQARRRLLASTKSAAIFSIVITLPIVFAGTALNMLRALGSMVRHDMLSGNACNLWWIVGYVIQVVEASQSGDPAPARILAGIVPITSVYTAWHVSPRLLGAILTLAATAWALGIARRARDLALIAALAGFVADAYFVLSAQVHENHFFVVIPLLVLAATLRREFAPILTALGIVFALNLYLFYGVGGTEPPATARTITIIDSTVLLSILNCGVFVWFALVFRRACLGALLPSGQGSSRTGGRPTSVSSLTFLSMALGAPPPARAFADASARIRLSSPRHGRRRSPESTCRASS